MAKKTKVEESSGILSSVRSLVFDAIDEVEFRVSNLLSAFSIAAVDVVDRVFDYGRALVLGLIYGVVGATQTLVVQFFLLITALVTVVIGSEE